MEHSLQQTLTKSAKNEAAEIKHIVRRIQKRDFSGDVGKALKNSVFDFATNLSAKFGALVFMIILARLLMPELFGLYSLALSTIILFVTFSNFGLFETMVRFVSRALAKKRVQKAKSYFVYLSRLKIILMALAIVVLLFSAKAIATLYYQKPIFLALLAGSFYLLFLGIVGVLKRIFQSVNDFKTTFYQEIIFQVARLIVVPGAVLFALNYALGEEQILFYVIAGLSFALLCSSLFLVSKVKRVSFVQAPTKPLPTKEKKKIHAFLLAISLTAISGSIFSHVDTIMLGRFVASEFIGYYAAAFSIVTASVSLITFSAALLPIFSGLNKRKLELFYKKSLRIVLAAAFVLFCVYLILSPTIIAIVFGEAYASSINILRIFSVVVFLLPIIGIVSTYLTSLGKPILITRALVISSLLNLVLNYLAISTLVTYSQMHAVYGATIATITSNAVYLGLLLFYKKKHS